ncbi:MAG: protein kinase [bacterium]|nr:protein kinase [bacterium]
MAARYTLIGEGSTRGAVGSGSYGRVFAARDCETQETVAVKRQPHASRVAMKEFSFYRALSQAPPCPHVVRLLNSFVASRQGVPHLYMVFPFSDATLYSIWRGHRGLVPVARAHGYLLHAVRGVAHLHAFGVVHGDLSLSNFLVSRENTVQVADLGGAASARRLALGEEERVLSTAYIRAPEVILGTGLPTVAVDSWALGVLSLWLLTGTAFFHEEEGEGLEPSFHPLRLQVKFLGPPQEAWPDCTGLRKWADAREAWSQGAARESPEAFLEDGDLVATRLARGGPASEFVLAWLHWCPSSRRTPAAALGCTFLRNASALDPASAALVEFCPAGTLRQVVAEALRTGTPITADMLPGAASRQDAVVAVAGGGGGGLEVPSPAGGAFCACSGNCGRQECKASLNARSRGRHEGPMCSNPPASSQVPRCISCACELVGCGKQRLRSYGGEGRWCQAHRPSEEQRGEEYYWNCHGLQEIGRSWSQELVLVARYAYALERAPPEALALWLRLAWKRGGGIPGRKIAPWEFAVYWVGFAVGSPSLVEEWSVRCEGAESATSEALYDEVRKLLLFADGCSTAFLDADVDPRTPSLVRFAVSMQMIGPPPPRRLRAKRGCAAASWIRLGPEGQTFVWLDRAESVASFEEFLWVAERAALQWPPRSPAAAAASDIVAGARHAPIASSEVTFFGDAALAAARELPGGSDLAEAFVGRLLLAVSQRQGPQALDDVAMLDIARFCPGGEEHLRPLLCHFAGEVRKRFGMEALFVELWARYWRSVPEADRAAWSQATALQHFSMLATCRSPQSAVREVGSPSRKRGRGPRDVGE